MKIFQLSFLALAAVAVLPVASGLLLNEACEGFTGCPSEYVPVCGSNAHTYSNACQLKLVACKTCDEKLHVVTEVSPRDSSRRRLPTCPVPDSPRTQSANQLICTSLSRARPKMKTPPSFLVLSALSLLLLSTSTVHAQPRGAGTENKCVFNCPLLVDPSKLKPVCGSDGHPYPSVCMLEYESCLRPDKLRPEPVAPEKCPFFGVLKKDEPRLVGILPVGSKPVNLDDGESDYETGESSRDSDGDFGPSDLDSSSSGDDDDDSAEGSARCEIMCMTRYDPVCASNGLTYGNRCELSVAKCLDPKLMEAYPGDCHRSIDPTNEPPKPLAKPPLLPNATPPYSLALKPTEKGYDQCAYICPMFNKPVCSEDGHVYDNRCVFASAFCRDSTLADATAEICKAVRV